MQLVKAADGVGAAAGMKRDEHVARFAVIVLRDAHPVAKFFEDPGPTEAVILLPLLSFSGAGVTSCIFMPPIILRRCGNRPRHRAGREYKNFSRYCE